LARLSLEGTNVRQHVKAHQKVLRNAIQQDEGSKYDVASDYRSDLKKHTLPLRKRLQALPPSPSLLPSAESSFRPAADKRVKRAKAPPAARRTSSARA
jgi:hypothetical protein